MTEPTEEQIADLMTWYFNQDRSSFEALVRKVWELAQKDGS